MMQGRAAEVQRGIWLAWFTVAYNSLEGLVAIAAGLFSGSIALVGFGLDSAIEVASGAVLIWRLHGDAGVLRETRERTALRFEGICFCVLAAYIACEAIASLAGREAPLRSVAGSILALASLIVMPLLARAKRRVAGQIGSPAMAADSRQSSLCMYLSAILLGGLLLNALWGWWWADPAAALVMAPIIGKEGWDALHGKTCCAACH
jgi:divalent metal cation (Fe/Co/Zn/Cd) transporter